MCLACEEADMYFRWQLIQQIAKGDMPEGHTADDLRLMGLPLPGEIEMVEEPDGTKIIRQKAPNASERGKDNAFACDSPEA